jgi:hypothetical protein
MNNNQLLRPEYWKDAARADVERHAAGLATTDSYPISLAKAELVRRDREYAEQQEEER